MSYFTFESKQVYYEVTGTGKPVVFLHGNTASSVLFETILPLYQEYQVILIDFLGHGRSDPLDVFPVELWFEEARQTIALIEHLGCKTVSLVGTSGGAWVALNVGLERPDLVERIVADSFSGLTLPADFAGSLAAERAESKKNPLFFQYFQGENWEHVVDCDTAAITAFARQGLPLYHQPFEELAMPVLFTGSRTDTMAGDHLEQRYRDAAGLLKQAEIFMLDTGEHPAIVSRAEAAAQRIRQFIGS